MVHAPMKVIHHGEQNVLCVPLIDGEMRDGQMVHVTPMPVRVYELLLGVEKAENQVVALPHMLLLSMS